MDLDETMVENVDNTEADDTLPDGVVEEDESEEQESYLDDEEGESEPAEEPQKKQEPQASEPGWIKQRVNKAVEKAVREALAQQQAEFEKQMAPLREKMLTDEAKELVRQGEFKSLERAKEYLQLKQGVQPKAEEPQQEQPRNERGQYQAREDAATSARIDMLRHQADRIREGNGPDVIAEFQNNPEIKKKVIAGEMDFYDVAQVMKSRKPGKRPPSPTRSLNGAIGYVPNAIESMSAEEFAKFDKKLDEGGSFTIRRR